MLSWVKRHKTLVTIAVMLAGVVIAVIEISLPEHTCRWVKASEGAIPDGAMKAGTADDGESLFACRATFKKGEHIGKLRKKFGGCNVPWGGKEHTVKFYEVLVSRD